MGVVSHVFPVVPPLTHDHVIDRVTDRLKLI